MRKRGAALLATAGLGYAYKAAEQPDGKIVLAGSTRWGAPYDIALSRVNTDGSLDTSFDGDGRAIIDLGSREELFRNAVAIQPDGKIVTAGGSSLDITVMRYNGNGSLDATFGDTGYVTTDFEGSNDHSLALALQADGKIVVAGTAYNGSNYDFCVVRYNSYGSLDTSFGD